jgi:hypothetical protein
MAPTKTGTTTKATTTPRAGAARSKPATATRTRGASKAAGKPAAAGKAATATTSKSKSATATRTRGATKPRAAADKTAQLSEEVLRSVESGQRAAIDAVRKFIDTVDQALPALGDGASRRQEVIDAAMEMADRLVHTQYDFIRKVVDSAGKSLKASDGKK